METSIASLVETARNATAPIVGIPIPGERPFCVRRDLLIASLKGLKIVDAAIQPSLDGNRRNYRLMVYAAGDRVQAIRKFVPLGSYESLLEWVKIERKKRATPKVRTSAREKEILKLQKKLAKLRTPQAPTHPLIAKGDTAERIRESDAGILRNWEQWKADGYPEMQRPLTNGEQWAAWKREARVRRWIQQQARACSKGKLTTAQLYRILADRGIKVQKWSDLRTHDKDRCEGVFGYLAILWEFCGLSRKPAWYFEPYQMPRCGREHYSHFLEWVVEYRQLVSLIATLQELENGTVTVN
jgi:hypothetical protein